MKEPKYEEKEDVKHDHDEMEEKTLEDCQDCQEILRMHKEKIMVSKNEKLKKFILKYYELDNDAYQSWMYRVESDLWVDEYKFDVFSKCK